MLSHQEVQKICDDFDVSACHGLLTDNMVLGTYKLGSQFYWKTSSGFFVGVYMDESVSFSDAYNRVKSKKQEEHKQPLTGDRECQQKK